MLPINIRIGQEALFEGIVWDSPVESEITFLRNIFLTRSGIGLKRFKLVDQTIHRYPGKRRHFYLYAMANYILRKKRYLKGQYLLIHNHWCPGYFHWMTEALPRLIKVLSLLEECTLLLPESFKGYPLESLKPYNVKKIYWIPNYENVVVEKLILPENPHFTASYHSEIIKKIRDDFKKHLLGNKLDELDLGENIYVTRGKTRSRLIANQENLVNFLKLKDFTIVDFENYSFWEQVSIMFHARVLVSVHGAGLTNMIFMKVNSYILEFQKQIIGKEDFSISYFKLSQIMGYNYLYQLCEPLDVEDSIYNADLIVDIAKLSNNLKLIEDKSEENTNRTV